MNSPESSHGLWDRKSRQQLPLVLARDYNACFSQSYEEKTFAKLTPDEMNIFSSRITFQSFCEAVLVLLLVN